MQKYLFLFVAVFILTGCKSQASSQPNISGPDSRPAETGAVPYDGIITLDYNRDYPTKNIRLADIADIEYITFKDKNVLFSKNTGLCMAVSDQNIVLCSPEEGDIFIFDHTGKLLKKFNRKGNGPEEYAYINLFTVDFADDEIFIFDHPLQYRVRVYSLDGQFKRTLPMPKSLWIKSAVDYNEKYILAFYEQKEAQPDNICYYLLSKSDSKRTPLKIEPKEIILDRVITSVRTGANSSRAHAFGYPCAPIVKNGNDLLLSDLGCDTIYKFDGTKIVPFIAKTPPVTGSGEPTLVCATLATDRYTFIRKVIRRREDNEHTVFAIDNHTGEVFEANIVNDDFPNKNFSFIDAFNKNLPRNYAVETMSTLSYIERNEKGLLKGKLKTLVSSLTEDDNNFMMIVKFK